MLSGANLYLMLYRISAQDTVRAARHCNFQKYESQRLVIIITSANLR